MPRDAATHYREMVEATVLQRQRLQTEADLSRRWDRSAPAYRFDPLRDLDPNLRLLASFIAPADRLIDVGGGAGRVGLALARQCAHLTNIEPSRGMGAEFLASAREAAITNVSLMESSWPATQELVADLVVCCDVTYFVADIVPFVRGLQSAARRRVLTWIWAIPPPNRNAALFELVFGEAKAPVPGHRELLPVLWDLGILPDVHLMPEPYGWPERLPRDRSEAVKFALEAVEAPMTGDAAARVEGALDRLFARHGDEYRPTWRPDLRGLLITWETGN